MSDETISVLIVDDHEVVRSGYRRLLESEDNIQVCAEASDGEEAYIKYIDGRPDVVVMDLTMEGMSGLEASRKIIARDPAAKILIFSVHENELYLNKTLDAGVKGYISKRSAASVMIEAVKHIARGELYIGQEMMPYLVARKSSRGSANVGDLTTRQFEIFRMLAEGKSVNEISEILSLSPKTVGHHYTQIKTKLNAENMADLARIAVRLELIIP